MLVVVGSARCGGAGRRVPSTPRTGRWGVTSNDAKPPPVGVGASALLVAACCTLAKRCAISALLMFTVVSAEQITCPTRISRAMERVAREMCRASEGRIASSSKILLSSGVGDARGGRWLALALVGTVSTLPDMRVRICLMALIGLLTNANARLRNEEDARVGATLAGVVWGIVNRPGWPSDASIL